MVGKIVSGGEKKAFEGFGAGSKFLNLRRIARGIQEIGGFHVVCGLEVVSDVENGVAFLDGEGLLKNVTIGELPEDFLAGEGVIEEVFAGLRRAFGMTAGVQLERNGTADDAVFLEDARGGAL